MLELNYFYALFCFQDTRKKRSANNIAGKLENKDENKLQHS